MNSERFCDSFGRSTKFVKRGHGTSILREEMKELKILKGQMVHQEIICFIIMLVGGLEHN